MEFLHGMGENLKRMYIYHQGDRITIKTVAHELALLDQFTCSHFPKRIAWRPFNNLCGNIDQRIAETGFEKLFEVRMEQVDQTQPLHTKFQHVLDHLRSGLIGSASVKLIAENFRENCRVQRQAVKIKQARIVHDNPITRVRRYRATTSLAQLRRAVASLFKISQRVDADGPFISADPTNDLVYASHHT
ncbi:hypothetical protein LL06_18800 [Hoeflea sp. BAL378]|nr:hypothetical protein LL06_18800 [Hoeflea sp. BAL378]